MLIPTIPHNLQPFYQIEPAIFGTGSTMNASARPPICGHDSEGFFSCSRFPRPVGAHAERNFFPGSILEPVAPHTLYHHKDAAGEPFCPQVVRLQYCPRSALTILRHVAVPRLRLTTAGFHSRRPGGFVWSRFFPLSVGFAPTASSAKGAFTMAPSMLCHDQAMPSISSYSANPFRQRRINTPFRFHSKKYLWIELALPNSPFGKAFHWHPVRNTKTMPSNTLRGSMGLRPPPGRRRYFRFFSLFRFGIRGSTRTQSSSDIVHDLIALMAAIYHKAIFEVNNYLRISSKLYLCLLSS